ncbi:DUF5947 family protein [Mycobacterium sp. shizuoka-1]|uniref:DUF5947 family protein n=1 Tax=Mycobacterium sp. shizuoka-1 TaxID=2039281 RepID=UPI000C061A7E|nr:DUF5947 family protein [Mycobacterium sp. shizuoka-1]GAY15027.1 hypothetical protein MSZK_17530 [Mycobacterium sp. shizuoka-1]
MEVLARIRTARPPLQRSAERCEMCADPIADEHRHVVDVDARQLMCVCRGCYLLFTDSAAAMRYRAVPDRYLAFPDFALGRREWDALQIPVGLAFFFHHCRLDRTAAFYPGPAGACESELDMAAWATVSRDPRIGLLTDDVEALLVRVPDSGDAPQCFLVPIDACYEFVGGLRLLWRGFDGGTQAREYIDGFFTRVAERAVVQLP